VSTALVQSASAGDSSLRMPPPTARWAGFYVGVTAAYTWSTADTAIGLDPNAGSPVLFGAALSGGHIPTSLSSNMNGAAGGLLAGYNWKIGSLIYGVEADIDYGNIRGSSSYSAPAGGGYSVMVTTHEQSMDWFGTLRARLGYLVTPNVLAYATGGLAVGHIKASTEEIRDIPNGCATNSLCTAGSASETRWGWTLGGGLEYAVDERWTVKGEYLYYNLGTVTYSMLTTAPIFPGFIELESSTKFAGHIVRLGVSRSF
jgi:outer membrane immunogenic protein